MHTFLKAYEVLRNHEYKTIAEKALLALPTRPVWLDYSLGTGLSGIGFTFTYAARVLRNQAWLSGAVWISGVIQHSYQPGAGRTGRWNMDGAENYSNDLINGNTGIILYLLMLNRELDVRLTT